VLILCRIVPPEEGNAARAQGEVKDQSQPADERFCRAPRPLRLCPPIGPAMLAESQFKC
jgi:hypothetical protein